MAEGEEPKLEDQKQRSLPWDCRVEQTEDRGRILVAGRSFKRGELILEETAILAAPASSLSMCLRCFKILSDCAEPIHCQACGFGFCGADCQAELTEVHLAECALLRRSFFQRWARENARAAWAVCRGLALKKCGASFWDQLCQFPAPTQLKEHGDLADHVASACVGVKEIGVVSSRDVRLLLGVCNTYAHLCWRAPVEADEQLCTDTLLGVFEVAGIPEHSCCPNCFKAFRQCGKDLAIQLRALADIPEGEALSLSYANLAEPTHLRQAGLKDKGFRCKCPRCADPSECQSFLSSIRCPSCGSRVSPPCCDYELSKTAWSCDACPVQLPWTAVRAFEESLEARLRELEKEAMHSYEAKAALAKFRDASLARLQPGHWVILRCNLAIGTFHPAVMMEDPDECTRYGVLQACDDALQVLHVFGPEMDDSRARLHTGRAAALAGTQEQAGARLCASQLRSVLYGLDRSDTFF